MLRRMSIILAIAFAAGAAGCASTPTVTRETVVVAGIGPVEVEQINVEVVAVEPAEQIVTVRQGPNTWQVAVPERFGNLQNIRAGDRVEIRRVEGVILGVRRARRGAQPGIVYAEAATDPSFENLPEKYVVRTLTLTAQFDNYDPATRIVNYVGPAGPRTHPVGNPVIQTSLRRLKRGDMVELTFVEGFNFQKY